MPKSPTNDQTLDLNKLRFLAFLSTIAIVLTAGTLAGLYARGYRFNREERTLEATGLLIVKSAPEGAQVFIDNELETATNDNITLEPGTYDVRIEKDGFITWNKSLTIEKEEVTEITAHLFKSAPALSPITLNSADSPVPSHDFTKIAFSVLPELEDNEAINRDDERYGLWVMETLNLPLGFSREPRRIFDADMTNASLTWSPDGREILIRLEETTYLIPSDEISLERTTLPLTQTELTTLLDEWADEKEQKFTAQIKTLPEEIQTLLTDNAYSTTFSPDEEMVLYTASTSATLTDTLIPQLPGSSTQKQDRDIKGYHTYVYDIEEDRNFLIDDSSENLTITGGETVSEGITRRLSWFPTSRNLILAEENRVVIMDYDGTNRQTVYAGSFMAPHAFPTVSLDRIFLLTNLGATDFLPNLYSVNLK